MFGKRFNLLTVAGFKIGIDISWFFIAFLLSWTLAVSYFPVVYPKLSNNTYWLMGISGMVGLFICVILHELGHAFVAKHYQLPVTQITLFIFGGVAEIKKEPTSPKIEFFMAIMGPIVSFFLALIFYLATVLGARYSWPLAVKGVTAYLAVINFLLACFNLIPAFPLDGGRIFRSLLWWWKKNLSWATRTAALVGSGFGFFMIFFGIFNLFARNFLAGVWLIVLGWFLHRAASSMQTQYYVGKELEGELVSKFMKRELITVPSNISIKEFVDTYVYTSHHHLYPVTEEDKLLGYISLQEVKTVLPNEWEHTLVIKVMNQASEAQLITPTTSALAAVDLFQQTQLATLFVVEQEKLVGLLTAQDLFKVISLKLELEQENR